MRRRIIYFCLGAGLTLILLGLRPLVSAQEATEEPTATSEESVVAEDIEISGDNQYCLLCHGQEGRTLTLLNGSTIDLHVNPQALADSVHGMSNPEGALGCVDCHGEMAFPHVGPPPTDARLYSIESAGICTQCHTEQAEHQADSVHAAGLARGNLRSATCTDCHGAHEVQPITDHPSLAANTCSTCHTSVFEEYKNSIHGEALLERGDTNAPSCIDCHGVHGINNPTTAQARNRSPELCASCHADEELMEKYDISTNVFHSYLNEFHGETVALFNQQDPNVASAKAVCYDCHGVHNITPADDSKSQVAKENLLTTCQQCHPNAEANFPDSWVGHFEPTSEDNPGLFAVDWFYKILIPMVIGGFAVMVVTDIYARIRQRLGG
ncbi:MAG: cytochrome c3 family protein, partial [Anaerolineae bacterium]|nr:cytochrome c3 family protein [Anaerolineae bacterium]